MGLDMKKNTSTTPDNARLSRWVGRQALRSVTTVMRCFDCGREPVSLAVSMRITADGVTGFAGLASCGRIWLCPVCNAKIMAQRALEVACALAYAKENNLHVLFGALTVRHNASSDLAELLELQRAAWDFVVSGRTWRDVSATSTVPSGHKLACKSDCVTAHRAVVDTGADGRVGYIRAAELTIGANGWHPHFHPIVFVRGSKRLARRIAQELVAEWVIGVEEAGGEARADGGQLMRVLDPSVAFAEIVGYVTKQTYSSEQRLALEAVWSQGKKSRGRAHSTEPHWAILEQVAAGDYSRIQRWDELELAVSGHRMIAWSRGLRDFASVGVEKSNEDIAAKVVGTEKDDVCFITPEGWAAIRDNPAQLVGYLDILKRDGWAALSSVMTLDGVDFFVLELATV